MPGLFDPFALKDVSLRNRIAVSPMTQYSCGPDGVMTDWHLVHLGARAVGGAGLVVAEQLAVAPEGRMTPGCAGLWNDAQAQRLAQVTAFIGSVGAVPGAQLGHSGRKGSLSRPWEGQAQLEPGDPRRWDTIGPSETPYGGRILQAPRAMTAGDIAASHANYAAAARRALDAGVQWLELHFAHGFLGASFMSPIANDRTDQYGGSPQNRARFLVETLDAVRAVWPERLPLTARIGAIDFHPESHTLDDSIALVRRLREHGLDLIDISFGMNTDQASVPWGERGFMIPAAARVRAEGGLPTAASWNISDPAYAQEIIATGQIDLLMIGRPLLANPHWPVLAALTLGREAPFDLLPDPYRHFLRRTENHPHVDGFARARG